MEEQDFDFLFDRDEDVTADDIFERNREYERDEDEK